MRDDEPDPHLARWLAAAPVGVALLDHELRYLRLNDAFAALTTHAAADCIGRAWRDVSPETASSAEPMLRAVLDRGDEVAEVELETARGQWYLASFFPVDGDVGAAAMEITLHKRREADLQHGVELRDQVLAVVSHDLRSPLQAISATASVLAAHVREPLAKHVEVIRGSAVRVHRLVEDLLAHANIGAGGFSLDVVRVSASALLDEVVELLQPIAVERDFRLEREGSSGPVEVICDRLRVVQVFGNLVDNSLRHARGGETIAIGAEVRSGEVVFFVRDHGGGIPPDVVRRFVAGTRVTALGLYICKGIVERHGGRIWIESEPGRGATVRFTMPIAQ